MQLLAAKAWGAVGVPGPELVGAFKVPKLRCSPCVCVPCTMFKLPGMVGWGSSDYWCQCLMSVACCSQGHRQHVSHHKQESQEPSSAESSVALLSRILGGCSDRICVASLGGRLRKRFCFLYLMVNHKHMYRYSIWPALAGLIEGWPHTWFSVLGYSNYIPNFLSVDLLTRRKFQITGSVGYSNVTCYPGGQQEAK